MSLQTRVLTKRPGTGLLRCLALLLLSASVLTASHVHDIDKGLSRSYFEHCAAYHAVDHQLSTVVEIPSIASVVTSCPVVNAVQSAESNSLWLPPSRAPPSIS